MCSAWICFHDDTVLLLLLLMSSAAVTPRFVKAADGLGETQRAKEKRGTSTAELDWEKAGALVALLTIVRDHERCTQVTTTPKSGRRQAGLSKPLYGVRFFHPISPQLTSFTRPPSRSIYHAKLSISNSLFQQICLLSMVIPLVKDQDWLYSKILRSHDAENHSKFVSFDF